MVDHGLTFWAMPDEPLPQLGAQVELDPEDLDDPQAINDKVVLAWLDLDLEG